MNVILGTNDLEIQDADGNLIDTIAYQTIDTIAYVYNPGTVVNSSTLGASPTITGTPQWSAVIWIRDGRKSVIQLGDVDNQSGWTNDQTGFDQLVSDIYAAFPAGGGGGGGITSIDGTPVGYVFTGSTTSVMGVDDAPTARNAIHAADYYPLWTFSTNTTTNADPGAHIFRMNSATIGSVSEITFSTTASFEGGDQSVEPWMYGWGDVIMLKNIANNDIIITAIGTQLNNSGYLRASCSLTATIIGGVANAQPTNNSVWRVVSVGDYIINANTQAQLNQKQNRIRAITTLIDTDALNLDASVDTYYQSDGAGTVTESVAASMGSTVVLKCGVGASKITFVPLTDVDGPALIDVLTGSSITVQSIGGGSWIII